MAMPRTMQFRNAYLLKREGCRVRSTLCRCSWATLLLRPWTRATQANAQTTSWFRPFLTRRKSETPMGNLFVAMRDRVCVGVEKLGGSYGPCQTGRRSAVTKRRTMTRLSSYILFVAIERRRQQLNAMPLALGVGLGLAPITVFWMRFFPPLRPFDFTAPAPNWPWFLLGVAACLTPYAAPASVFRRRVRAPRWPGMDLFHRAAPDGAWINARLRAIDPAYRVIRNRADLLAHLKSGEAGERAHWMFLILSALTSVYALRIGEPGTAALLLAGNVVYNVYPILHQRRKRARARHVAIATERCIRRTR